MKNKKIFSMGLWREGRSQVRAVGIAYCCICILVSAFCSMSYIGDALDKTYNYYDVLTPFRGAVDDAAWIGVFIALPVMMLMLFSFVNSRRAADFYHSVPRTRLQLLTSFSISAAFWVFLGIGAAVLTEFVVALFCGMDVAWGMFGMYIINLIAVYIQVCGIFVLAISISTGILNQIAAACIIAFLPRIMIFIMSAISESGAPILMGLDDSLGRFGEVDINLLFFNSIFSKYSVTFYSGNCFANEDFIALFYTLGLGIIYGALGTICFCRRKSEAATATGANKYVQCAIRVLVSFVICLIPCYFIGEALIGAESKRDFAGDFINMLPTLLLVYGFALIAYFLYEAITTRRIKGVVTLKGTMGIGLLALVLLNIVFIVTPTVIANAALSTDINTDNVESVSLYMEKEDELYISEYYRMDIDDIEFKDPEMLEIICNSLNKNVEVIKSGNYKDYFYRSNMTSAQYTFNMKDGRKINRRVYMRIDDDLAVYDIMKKDAVYIQNMRTMPSDSEILGCYSDTVGLDDANALKLWKTLRKEIEAMSDEEFFAYEYPDDSDYEEKPALYDLFFDEITIEGVKNGISWMNSYRINGFVPETRRQYIELVNSSGRHSAEKVSEMFRNSEETYVGFMVIDLSSSINDYYQLYSFSFTEEAPGEEELKVMDYVCSHWNDPVDTDGMICIIDYSINDYDGYVDTDGFTWVEGRRILSGSEIADMLAETEWRDNYKD